MLGAAIKKYLDDKGITQSFICEKSGIKPPILNAILKGNRRLLADEYNAICLALGVPLETFFKGHNKAS